MKKVLIAGHDGERLSALLTSLAGNQEPINWAPCDVFSFDELVQAMKGFDEVYFFEKISALPLGLVQGKTEDIELLMITNLLEAAKLCGMRKVFYIGQRKEKFVQTFERSGIPFEIIEYQVSDGLVLNNTHDVRSVQKFVLPPYKKALWVGEEYFKWLPKFFSNIIKVRYDGKECSFFLFNEMICILKLRRSAAQYPGRISFNVIGGLLNGKKSRGKLEFIETLDKQYVFGALHNFVPALPWIFYRFTQAIVHALVMGAYGEHLKWCYLIGDRK